MEVMVKSYNVGTEFWKDRRVFITGNTGFKGTWLSVWLQYLGANLTGFSYNAPSEPNMFSLIDFSQNFPTIRGDVCDLKCLQNALIEAEPEIVFHLAAQPLVRKSYSEPVETYRTNIMGTVNVLEAVRSCSSVRSLLNITTDKCYENNEWIWGYRENERLGGYDPYSSSKACSEIITNAYQQSFFNVNDYSNHRLAVATARAGNVIGGGDWGNDRLVPDVLESFSAGENVLIRSPKSTRPWQHVLDLIHGYLMLAERLFSKGAKFNGPWNFGPQNGGSKSVEWIVSKLSTLWGSGDWDIDESAKPHEANQLRLDTTKANENLNWYPRLNIDESLELTVDWFKDYKDRKSMFKTTLSQIDQYTSK
jgi:CDP-glucose 4,6-dehydratase